VDNIVGSASGVESRRDKVKRVAIDEAKQFLGIFLYLAIVFGVFVLHEWLVLSSKQIHFRFYGLALINALIFAKILLVAEHFHLAERFRDKPLAIPIAYKSAAFTALLIVAYIVEEVILGLLHGKNVAEAMPRIGDGTIWAWLCIAVIMTFALVPFFAYREMSRALGGTELRRLLFGRGPKS
jgi:putative copper export protein